MSQVAMRQKFNDNPYNKAFVSCNCFTSQSSHRCVTGSHATNVTVDPDNTFLVFNGFYFLHIFSEFGTPSHIHLPSLPSSPQVQESADQHALLSKDLCFPLWHPKIKQCRNERDMVEGKKMERAKGTEREKKEEKRLVRASCWAQDSKGFLWNEQKEGASSQA